MSVRAWNEVTFLKYFMAHNFIIIIIINIIIIIFYFKFKKINYN